MADENGRDDNDSGYDSSGGLGLDDGPVETRTPAERMLALFRGFEGAHGTHGSTGTRSAGIKQEIKKSARTIREPVTEKLWQDHLDGERALGVIPIRADSGCFWGVIDVDDYEVSHVELYRKLEDRKLPLVISKSKSGGAHLFLFMRDQQSALDVRSLLGGIAASLGLGGCEIFPKQTELLLESGDAGNWLNMPYLGGDKTERYAITSKGGAMTLDQFLRTAEAASLTGAQFSELVSIKPAERARPGPAKKRRAQGKGEADDSDAAPLEDGPPCLEHLASAGFAPGTRNNGLFAIGVYCQKRYGEKWADKLEEMNQAFMTPPLSSEEVIGIKRSLEKQEYQYSCKQVPLSTHCNQALCRTRRHGISSSGDYPVISSLSVLDTDPPVWFLDIEDERLAVNTDELSTYKLFQKLIMERLHKIYKPLKQETWINMISVAMMNIVVIEAPEEVGKEGHFRELLVEFLTNRQKGTRIEDLHSGRPFEDETKKRHYFRLKDLQAYLIREGIQTMTRPQIVTAIKKIGGDSEYKVVKAKGLSTWWIPTSAASGPPTIDPPEVAQEPM